MKRYKHPIYKDYSCDEDGKVYSKDKLLTGTQATAGYWQYYIKGKTILAHRFIYECINDCVLKPLEIINHLDHNKLNNKINNLEKTTVKGNAHHYQNEIGRYLIKNPDLTILNEAISGEKNYASKLTNEQAKQLILRSLTGEENSSLAKDFGLHERYVSLIRHKKRWKSVWVELGLESSETIPSGSRPTSVVEAGCPPE